MTIGMRQHGRRSAVRAARAGRWRSTVFGRFGTALALFALLQSAVLLFHIPMRGPGISFGATISLSSHIPGDAPSDHGAHHQPHHQQGDEADGSEHEGPACPVCFAIQKAGMVLMPAVPGTPPAPPLAAQRSIALAQAPASNPDVSIPQPRAPPEKA